MPGLGGLSLEVESDPFALGPLKAEPMSTWLAPESGPSAEVVLMRGEEEV